MLLLGDDHLQLPSLVHPAEWLAPGCDDKTLTQDQFSEHPPLVPLLEKILPA
jgi:hypothetical protein